ncbi:hypothetical protein BC628DRAFT_1414185 [Trametes gibbosa]|nr:hypothetical protein C2E23DRAFT_888266 [Lenzites betulinus]KAI0833376.1 hypothetical protein BC628DRAFT_1414185 [Trametes gibbosa]
MSDPDETLTDFELTRPDTPTIPSTLAMKRNYSVWLTNANISEGFSPRPRKKRNLNRRRFSYRSFYSEHDRNVQSSGQHAQDEDGIPFASTTAVSNPQQEHQNLLVTDGEALDTPEMSRLPTPPPSQDHQRVQAIRSCDNSGPSSSQADRDVSVLFSNPWSATTQSRGVQTVDLSQIVVPEPMPPLSISAEALAITSALSSRFDPPGSSSVHNSLTLARQPMCRYPVSESSASSNGRLRGSESRQDDEPTVVQNTAEIGTTAITGMPGSTEGDDARGGFLSSHLGGSRILLPEHITSHRPPESTEGVTMMVGTSSMTIRHACDLMHRADTLPHTNLAGSFGRTSASAAAANVVDTSEVNGHTRHPGPPLAAGRNDTRQAQENVLTRPSAPQTGGAPLHFAAIKPQKELRPFRAGSQEGYTFWWRSEAASDLPHPPLNLSPRVGDLYLHHNNESGHVTYWVWRSSGGWANPTEGEAHPSYLDRCLWFRSKFEPSWVTRHTYRTYKGKQRREDLEKAEEAGRLEGA